MFLQKYALIPVCFSSFCFAALLAANEDWTQWGGEHRDFKLSSGAISDNAKLDQVWRRDLGNGYSAILVQGDRLYTMYRRNDEEFVVCADASDGKTVWEFKYAAPMREGASTEFGKGPNSTPIVVGDVIISIGFNSDLYCLDKESGELLWKKNLITELDATRVDLGYSQSPIVYKDNLILPVGGAGKGIVALGLQDGSIKWTAQDFKNSYSTPLLVTLDGKDQMVFVMTDEVVSIDPADGRLFWTFPLTNQWSTHAFVPLWDPESKTLFISSFRQSHALQLKREGDGFSFANTWSSKERGIGFTNAVIIDGVVYGSTGSSRSALVTAIDLASGKFLWKERGFSVSNYLAVGDRLILLDQNGNLAIARPDGSGLNVIRREQVLSAPRAWTVPTMVGNRLYLRDQKEMICYELN